MVKRVRPALALVSTGSEYGGWKVLMLDTLKVATTDTWVRVPMDTVTCQAMDKLAARNVPLPSDLEFQLSNRVIEIPAEEGDNVEDLHQILGRREREVQRSSIPDYDPTQAVEEDDGVTSVLRGARASQDQRAGNVVQEAGMVEPAFIPVSAEEQHATITDVLRAGDGQNTVEQQGELQEAPAVQEAPVEVANNLAQPVVGLLPATAANEVNVEVVGQEGGFTDPVERDIDDVSSVSTDESAENSRREQLGFTDRVHRYNLRSTRRYNLRSNRHYGHREGPWQERSREYGLHLSVRAALEKHREAAEESMLKEVQNIHGKGVFEPVGVRQLGLQERRKIIRSSMFLKEKYLSTGAFEKLKSRFVAGGNMQDRGLYDEGEISSPTVSLSSVYLAAGLAAKESRKVRTMDIGGAYLNADMEREVLLRVEPRIAKMFVSVDPIYSAGLDSDGSLVVRLKKALYGCVESAKLWYDTLSSKLKALGFKVNRKDCCIYNKMFKGKQLTVCVYVDDLLCTCVYEEGLEWLEKELRAEFKELNVNGGAVHSYLGQTLDFSVDGKCKVTMEGYVADLLAYFKVTGSAATPAQQDLFAVDEGSPKLQPDASAEFHSCVAKLLYLTKRVRPDIMAGVIFLTTRVTKATQQDQGKLTRILKYLNATQDLGIVLEPGKGLQVVAYVDASFATHADFKSHTGGVITLGWGPIYCKSTRQKLTSKSSTEAELIGVSDMLPQVIWTRDFLMEQGYAVGPATLMQDNMSTIALANKGHSTAERTRHIAIRFYFVKDRVDSGEVAIQYLPTEEMIADILTKPLQGDAFRKLRRLLLNWEY
jgi:hypothetical protein